MDCELKPGDRVRVTSRCRIHGYQPGDKGTVLRDVVAGPSGTCYFVVAMDKDQPDAAGIVFSDDEIELDV